MRTKTDYFFLALAAIGVTAATLKLARYVTVSPAARAVEFTTARSTAVLDALYADPALVESLLKDGADVNAADAYGLTPLMRAATMSEATVKLLLAHRADVQARSAVGNDALVLAARKPGNSAIVRLLLEHGAPANGRAAGGATPLLAAVAAEDEASVQLLLDAGADPNASPNPDEMGFLFGGGRTPLMWAAYRRHAGLVKQLLARGAKVNDATGLGSALHQAAWANSVEAARVLLDAGADVNQRDLKWNFTPLHWAAASEHDDPALVKLLLERGADVNAEGGQNVDNYLGVAQTPLMHALRRGPATRIVAALRAAGAQEPEAVPAAKLVPPAEARNIVEAIRAAARPLQHTATESKKRFLLHASKQNCASCHQQHVPLMAMSAAQERGAGLEPGAVQAVLDGLVQFDSNPFNAQPVFQPEPALEFGYSMMGFKAQGLPRSAVTDGMIHSLLVYQAPDGRWHYNLPRPPMESSDIAATALALHCFTLYPDPRRTEEIAAATAKGRRWLESAPAETTEEKAYRLLGLAWAGSEAPHVRQAAEQLQRDQRAGGGWGQLEQLPADAYGTGLALYALLTTQTADPGDRAVLRAAAFLRDTQNADGTWHVQRRAIPFQPPMQSEFPHGADGWISSTGTSWAVLALALLGDQTTAAPAALPEVKSASETPAQPAPPITSRVDFTRDLKPLLDRSCSGCHSGEKPKGGYDVSTPESLVTAGSRGEPVINAQEPGASLLLRAIGDEEPDFEMPPLAKRHKYPALSQQERGLFAAWISQRNAVTTAAK